MNKDTIYRTAATLVAVVITIATLLAQKRSFNAATDFGLTPADRSVLVGVKHPNGTDTVKFGWAWKAQKVQGMDYATFRKLTMGTVCILEAAWSGEAPGNLGRFQNGYNFLELPVGAYEINATCAIPRRGIKGQGSYPYYGENAVTTELIMQSTWYALPGETERALLRSPNWSVTSDMGYNESATVENLALTGPKLDDGITRIGLALRKFGECTYVNQVRSDWFTYGFVASGGVPLTIGTITAFHNVKAGFVALGSAGATINLGTLSGDDNAELLGLHPGYGSSAGGIINIGLLKIETAVTEEARGVWRGMIAGYLEGQFSVNVGVVSGAASKVRCDALFVVNPNIPAYGPQGAQLSVGSVAHFGYATALQNIQAGTRVASPPSHQAYDLRWNAIGNAFASTYPGLRSTPCGCKDRLGFLRGTSGAFDYAACTPVYPGSAGGSNPVVVPPVVVVPVPTPTPPSTTLKWSTAFDGTTLTRLMTGSITNATSSASWSGMGALRLGTGTTQVNSIFPALVPGATRAVLRGCTFASAADWSYLNSAVRVMADGSILWSATGAVLGQMPRIKADVVLVFPVPVDLSTVLGMAGGQCPVFIVDAMEIY